MTSLFHASRGGRPTALFVTVGLALSAVYAFTDSNPLRATIAIGLAFAALVALVAGIRHYRPQATLAWVLIAVSQLFWLVGWIPWEQAILTTGAPPASFSLADVFFLPMYPLLAAGLLLLIRGREPRGGGAIETVMLGVAAAVFSLIFLIEPFLGATVLPREAALTQVVYALFDIVVLAVLARAFLGSLRGTSYRLLLGGIAALLLAGTAWNWLSLAGTYTVGAYSDVGWLICAVLFGGAALHPSMRSAGARHDATVNALDPRRVVVLAVGALAAPTLAVTALFGQEHDTVLVVGATLLLSLLVVLRMVALLREGERLRLRLETQNESLVELDRMKDEFVASVSHELRTPLTSIRGYLELVLDGEGGPLSEDQRSFLGVVDRNSERLLRVVGDLLFVAQIDAGALPLERKGFDPALLVQNAAEAARPVAEGRGIDLTVDVGTLPHAIDGDEARLAQALDNLVSNALKFTPSGGTVSLRATAPNGSVELGVADTGPGISAGDQQRLFERFFRTADANERAVPGTGLGLAITKAIVEAHGGSIGVESEIGQGTEFRIVLPAAA